MIKRLQKIEEMLIESPRDSFLLFALAKELEKKNLITRSLETYGHLVKVDPAYIGTYYHYAQLLINVHKPAEAKKIIDAGKEIALRLGDHHAKGELMVLESYFEEE